MNAEIISRLLAINARFYQDFSAPFSASRYRVQPGVARLVSQHLANNISIRWLDLGCGNGNLARHLLNAGFKGVYLGLDSSEDLLLSAKTQLSALDNQSASSDPNGSFPTFTFHSSNLTSPIWDEHLPPTPFEIVSAFAVLHHLPGADCRLQLMRRVKDLIPSSASFLHSEWQFQNSRRLASRIKSWDEAGIPQAEVEPGDTLLDWRSEGIGLRYVHLFTESELNELAQKSGFWIRTSFYSDGKEGNLSLYQVWQPTIE